VGSRAGLEGCGKSRLPSFKSVMAAIVCPQLQTMFFPTAHTYGFHSFLKMKAIISLNVVSRYVFVLQAKRVLVDNIKNKLTKTNFSDMECNNMAQDMEYWRILASTVGNILF
jgi:hypothetical protein